MKKLSKAHINKLKGTLTGRLRLSLYQSLSGKADVVPSDKQAAAFIEEVGQVNPVFAFYFYSFFDDTYTIPVEFSRLQMPKDIKTTLIYLEEHPLKTPTFFLIQNCQRLFGATEILAWVECSDIKEPFKGKYYTIVLTKEGNPRDILGYIEIRAAQTNPNPAFSYYGENGAETRNTDDFIDNPLLVFYISLLNFLVEHPVDRFISDERKITTLSSVPYINYPIDSLLTEKLNLLYTGQVGCLKAKVKLKDVIPYSYEFCIDFPDRFITDSKRKLDKVLECGILTYESNGFLIMSDNYSYYLALRKEKIEEVTVVNIGELSLPHQVIEVGGKELLPSVPTISGSMSSLPIDLKEELLEQRLDKLNTYYKIERIRNQDFQEIKEWISNNKLIESLNELILVTLDKRIHDEIILMKSRLSKLKSDIRRGILTHELQNIELNKIKNDILELISEL